MCLWLSELDERVVSFVIKNKPGCMVVRLPDGREVAAPRSLLNTPGNPTIGLFKALGISGFGVAAFLHMLLSPAAAGLGLSPSLASFFWLLAIGTLPFDLGLIWFYRRYGQSYADEATKRWAVLAYCPNDGIVFREADGQYVEPEKIRVLLGESSLVSAYVGFIGQAASSRAREWCMRYATWLVDQEPQPVPRLHPWPSLTTRVRTMTRSSAEAAAIADKIQVGDRISLEGIGEYTVEGIAQCQLSGSHREFDPSWVWVLTTAGHVLELGKHESFVYTRQKSVPRRAHEFDALMSLERGLVPRLEELHHNDDFSSRSTIVCIEGRHYNGRYVGELDLYKSHGRQLFDVPVFRAAGVHSLHRTTYFRLERLPTGRMNRRGSVFGLEGTAGLVLMFGQPISGPHVRWSHVP